MTFQIYIHNVVQIQLFPPGLEKTATYTACLVYTVASRGLNMAAELGLDGTLFIYGSAETITEAPSTFHLPPFFTCLLN